MIFLFSPVFPESAMSMPSESADDVTDQMDQDCGDYQFGWRQIGTFSIDFVKPDGKKVTVVGDLTRAFIKWGFEWKKIDFLEKKVFFSGSEAINFIKLKKSIKIEDFWFKKNFN